MQRRVFVYCTLRSARHLYKVETIVRIVFCAKMTLYLVKCALLIEVPCSIEQYPCAKAHIIPVTKYVSLYNVLVEKAQHAVQN